MLPIICLLFHTKDQVAQAARKNVVQSLAAVKLRFFFTTWRPDWL